MICLLQDEIKQAQGSQSSSDPAIINVVIAIQRNEFGQIYVVQGLERSLHFSSPTSSVQSFSNALYPVSKQSDNNKARRISHVFIPNTTNYTSVSKDIAVINGSCNMLSKDPVLKCNLLVSKMFESGLANNFKYQEKKRSANAASKCENNADDCIDDDDHDLVSGVCSVPLEEVATTTSNIYSKTESHISNTSITSSTKSSRKKSRQKKKKRKKGSKFSQKQPSMTKVKESSLPTVTLGWSVNDAHQYRFNKSTVFGNVKPFLRDGGLNDEVKSLLLDVIETSLESVPDGVTCFDVDNCSDNQEFISARKEMIQEFYELLGGKGKCNFKTFRIEGITIIIPLGIAAHRDMLNCALEGMSSVLQINTRVPMNEKTIPGGRTSILWKWLELNGYSEWFPCSIILYSRKSVSMYCQKKAAMSTFASQSPLHKAIRWAVMDRVGSDVDYLSHIWNSDTFIDKFMKKAKQKKSSYFGGRFLSCTAAYDKTVSRFSMQFIILSHIQFNHLYLFLHRRTTL